MVPVTRFLVPFLFIVGARCDPAVTAAVDQAGYTISVDGAPWYKSPQSPTVCVGGQHVSLPFRGANTSHGSDQFGTWTGTTASYSSTSPAAELHLTFKQYAARPELVVATASFPSGLDTSNCGTNTHLSTRFPSFDVSAAMAPTLHTLSWRGQVLATTAAAKGLGILGANGPAY